MLKNIAHFLLLLSVISCTSYDIRDRSNRQITDYDDLIQKNPSNHEGYYKRAALWGFHCPLEGMGVIDRCLADIEKAITLAGDKNARFEYYAQRGWCRAAAALDSCYWDILRPNKTQAYIGTPAEVPLKQAVADFSKSIILIKEIKDAAALYSGRAVLSYYLDAPQYTVSDLSILWSLDAQTSWDDSLFHYYNNDRSKADKNYVASDLEARSFAEIVRVAREKKSPELASLEGHLRILQERAARYSKVHSAELATKAKNAQRAYEEAWARKTQGQNSAAGTRTGRKQICEDCKGSGVGQYYDMGESAHCLADRHTGKVKQCNSASDGRFTTRKCHACGGTGYVFDP